MPQYQMPAAIRARALPRRAQRKVYRAHDQFLWDNVSISATGTQSLFQQPQGNGTSAIVASGGKTIVDTSQTTAGILPAGYLFRVYEVGFATAPSSAPENVETALQGIGASLTILNDTVQLGPLWFWPAGAGIVGYAALYGQGTATERSNANNGVPAVTARVRLRVPFQLEPQYPFSIALNCVSAPSAIVVYSILFGTLIRRV